MHSSFSLGVCVHVLGFVCFFPSIDVICFKTLS